MLSKLVADDADALQVFAGGFHGGRIFEVPLLPAPVISKGSPAKSRRNASAISVRHEFPEHRKSTLGLIIGLAPTCNR
jgi:hypothetical protein